MWPPLGVRPQAQTISVLGNQFRVEVMLHKWQMLETAFALRPVLFSLLPPYAPASLSVVYSRIFCRASGRNSGDNNMRLMTAADRPEPLWLALRMVQVVLRASPSASDCWSRVTNPASMRDCPSSRIFATCRDFISVTGRSQSLTNLFEPSRGRACARSQAP